MAADLPYQGFRRTTGVYLEPDARATIENTVHDQLVEAHEEHRLRRPSPAELFEAALDDLRYVADYIANEVRDPTEFDPRSDQRHSLLIGTELVAALDGLVERFQDRLGSLGKTAEDGGSGPDHEERRAIAVSPREAWVPDGLAPAARALWPTDPLDMAHHPLRETFLRRLVPHARQTLRDAASLLASDMLTSGENLGPREQRAVMRGIAREAFGYAALLKEITDEPRYTVHDPAEYEVARLAGGFVAPFVALGEQLAVALDEGPFAEGGDADEL